MLALILIAACASETPPPDDGPPAGYTRYVTTPITIEPGQSGQWVEWVADPVGVDMDVIEIIGAQSAGGHHAILYGSEDPQPVRTMREWVETDQLATRFLGGVGGEGGADFRPPEGAVLRIPAGSSLVIQTHYVNTTDEAIVGDSTLDVKMVPASPDHLVASFFGVGSIDIVVTPGQSFLELDCVLERDIPLVMWSNHMHNYGSKVTSVLLDGDQEIMLKDDPQWNYEWALSPNFVYRTIADPMVLPAGSTVRTRCEWSNTTADTIGFPDEMCAFFGFYIGDTDVTCSP